MEGDPKYNLSIGIDNFMKGLQFRHPDMSHREMEQLGNAYLSRIGEVFRSGEELGSWRLRADGNFDLRIWNIGETGGEK